MRRTWILVMAALPLAACASSPTGLVEPGGVQSSIAVVSESPTPTPTPTFGLSKLPTTPPGGTRMKLFDWRVDLNLGSEPVRAAAESCWEAVTSSRGDAFRCVDDQNVLSDPCYIADAGMVCPDGPFLQTYRLLTMPPEQLELVDQINLDYPWGLAIAGSDKCSAVAGAGELRQGLRFNYRCSRGMLWGDIDRSKDVWRIRWSAKWSSPFRWVKISLAVY